MPFLEHFDSAQDIAYRTWSLLMRGARRNKKEHRLVSNTSYLTRSEWSKTPCKSSSAWLVPPSSSHGAPVRSPRVPGTPCSPRRISMGEETKAREIARHGGDDDEEEGEKKGAEMAPHVQRVFGASPGAVGKLLFSAPSFSPSCPPVPGSPSRASRALRLSSFATPGSPRAIRTLARPTPLLFLHYSSSILQARPVPPSHLLVRPQYPRYPEEREKKREKKREKQKEKGRKTPGRAGVSTKCEIRVCQNGRWRFSLKPMGD